MPVFKKRNRIVSFRVSDEEYLVLQRISEQLGAHSVSAYARHLACRSLERHPHEPFSARLESLSARVEELHRNVAHLSALITRLEIPN
ncbi:MAG: hypothetical protein IT158_14555 [Bryobacterales bacterium]|nr:hypothetical protein [Bryobacterales bacterium]